ncbi:mitochondrial ribosomal protein L35 [Bombus vancouverensis nearcticus]|uniref:Large ribosomal subunit protein bL35m n=1 Tax=Bombus bifarius TaxID=103933 RepID=A0A6P8MQX2_9HYME|nr:39S ribosomal protein L35, mitochondrial [Bombus vancouverensis nearcticus]XP_033304797.1 39S ribosomal protein L35, mitochondrial [Bombus bifarius]
MLRILSTAIRDIALRDSVVNVTSSLIPKQCPITQCIQHRFFGAFSSTISKCNDVGNTKQKPIFGKIQVDSVVSPMLVTTTTPARTVTKYSRKKGKRKSVKAVLDRFYRLNWGIWIRTFAGRHRSLWKKSQRNKYRLRQHVFCNATQSTMLDKMVTSYWKRPHYYVDDPYNPYHKREEFPFTRTKPRPF